MKTDRTISKRIKLSNRLSVDVTLGFGGQLVCEWTPCLPKKITPAELQAYRKGRDELIADYAREIGGKVLLIEA